MANRTRYGVLPLTLAEALGHGRKGWKVTRDGLRLAAFDTQAEAVTFAAATARADWTKRGQTAELTIRGRDGRIRDTRSYGRDPRRTKG